MSQIPQLAPIFLQGVNQGADSFAQAQGLSLAMRRQQQFEEQTTRQIAQEEAAKRALLARYDVLNPAPSRYVDEQLPDGMMGPGAMLPNPAYDEHAVQREAIRGAPAEVMSDIVGGFEDVSRAQRIADYKAKKDQDQFDNDISVIEEAAKLGHDETDSPRIAALKHKHGLPLSTTKHLTPEAIKAVMGGDPDAIAQAVNSGMPAGVLGQLIPNGGKAATPPVNPQDLLTMYDPKATREAKAQAASNLRGAKYPANFGAASMGPEKKGATGENTRLVQGLAQQQKWTMLAKIAGEVDNDGLPTPRAIEADLVLTDNGRDAQLETFNAAFEAARNKYESTPTKTGWWGKDNKKAAETEMEAARSAMVQRRIELGLDQPKSTPRVPAGGPKASDAPPPGKTPNAAGTGIDGRAVMEQIRKEMQIPLGAQLSPEQRQAMKAEFERRTGGSR